MHSAGDGARICAGSAAIAPGQRPCIRETLGKIFDDGERIPDRDVAVNQGRHLARAEEAEMMRSLSATFPV